MRGPYSSRILTTPELNETVGGPIPRDARFDGKRIGPCVGKQLGAQPAHKIAQPKTTKRASHIMCPAMRPKKCGVTVQRSGHSRHKSGYHGGPYPTMKNGQSKRRKERSVADAQQDHHVASSWLPLAASRFLVPPGARTLGSFRKTSGIQLAASSRARAWGAAFAWTPPVSAGPGTAECWWHGFALNPLSFLQLEATSVAAPRAEFRFGFVRPNHNH